MREWDEPSVDPDENGYRTRANFRRETPSIALLRALAALVDRKMRNLPRLYDSFNPGAFNRLLTTASETDQKSSVEVDIEGYTAVVRDDGTMTIYEDEPADGDGES